MCHGDQSLKVTEKLDLPSPHTHISLFPVILDSLVLHMVTACFHPWVSQKRVECLQKNPFPILHQEKTGNLRIFLQVENLEKMQIAILSQSDVMFLRHMISSWFYICKQVISCNNISWGFFFENVRKFQWFQILFF